ncbi:MAG: glycosyltransferase family 2 protein [Deltaproteobacteria bacterium]|nr:glycosyltransferase family 2 protein [Deltaproteobacteria bacterium]
MPDLQKISVAILSWNGRQHLEICLPALAKQKPPGVPWEILVLDNGSTDDTVSWLKKNHPEVSLVESPTNLGFCGGNNRLVEAAQGDAVVLLNNDTRPQESWLAALTETYRSAPKDVAAVSGCILDWSGDRLDFGRGLMTFDGHAFQMDFRRPLSEARLPAADEELPFACGGNLMIRKSSFLRAGGFDESYFAYLEDVDLGWRLWSGGERVIFSPEAVVHHRSGATSDLLGLFNRGFLFERNAFLTVYKNYESGLWEKIMPAVELTLLNRTQTMLEQNNPGGGLLNIDPYAGHIANTAVQGEAGEVDPERGDRTVFEGRQQRWKRYGVRELVGRGLLKLTKRIWPQAPALVPPCITDERTIAQLRAQSYLLRNLDRAAETRKKVQSRRRRSDLEIFERFPAYLVPTYPGDEKLFSDPGFRSWLPEELPTVEAALGGVMELG